MQHACCGPGLGPTKDHLEWVCGGALAAAGLRDTPMLERAIGNLERAGWLVPVETAVQIGKNRRRKSWRIVRPRQP